VLQAAGFLVVGNVLTGGGSTRQPTMAPEGMTPSLKSVRASSGTTRTSLSSVIPSWKRFFEPRRTGSVVDRVASVWFVGVRLGQRHLVGDLRQMALAAAFLLALALLTSCSPASPSSARVTSTTRTAVQRSTARTAGPAPTNAPAPINAPLAPPPQTCAVTPPPQIQHLDHLGANSRVQLVGGGPFWLYDGSYQSVLHLGPTGYTQWPIWKWVVEVGPSYTQPVTLRLQNQETGGLSWWTDAQTPPVTTTQTLVLDPLMDFRAGLRLPSVPHGQPDPGWKEWGVFPLFQQSGCYALQVSWLGGSWESVFAVGN
jgi:hypothetical protein